MASVIGFVCLKDDEKEARAFALPGSYFVFLDDNGDQEPLESFEHVIVLVSKRLQTAAGPKCYDKLIRPSKLSALLAIDPMRLVAVALETKPNDWEGPLAWLRLSSSIVVQRKDNSILLQLESLFARIMSKRRASLLAHPCPPSALELFVGDIVHQDGVLRDGAELKASMLAVLHALGATTVADAAQLCAALSAKDLLDAAAGAGGSDASIAIGLLKTVRGVFGWRQ
jgi:hypothetical protein